MKMAEKQKILDELGGIDEADYDALVKELIAEAEKQIPEFEDAIRRDDFVGISKIAHAIKGAAGNLRIYKIEALAKALEAEAKEKKDRSKIAASLQGIIQGLAELKTG